MKKDYLSPVLTVQMLSEPDIIATSVSSLDDLTASDGDSISWNDGI